MNLAGNLIKLRNKINELGLNANDEEIQAFFTAIVAVAAAVVVVYAAVYDEVAVETEYYGTVKKGNIDLITENNPILNIWTLRDKKDKTYFVVDAFMENQITEVTDIIKQRSPFCFDRNSEEYLRNLLRINLLK
ncbi:MAG: hypothetical protein LBS04_05440 [Tannerellaceae bacterium]|jgi:hypothetical protein|nr:hypothetical protein [Tannerellaceae bacterium]